MQRVGDAQIEPDGRLAGESHVRAGRDLSERGGFVGGQVGEFGLLGGGVEGWRGRGSQWPSNPAKRLAAVVEVFLRPGEIVAERRN